jgi:hypothetical protein
MDFVKMVFTMNRKFLSSMPRSFDGDEVCAVCLIPLFPLMADFRICSSFAVAPGVGRRIGDNVVGDQRAQLGKY